MNDLLKNRKRLLRDIIGLVILMWLLCIIILGPLEEKGIYGDMFGSVNALFSGLAFAALIYTINQQREELSLQRNEIKLNREELRLTREELAGQRAQMATQNDVLKIQNFENTFFQLLRLLNDLVNGMEVRGPKKGRECFEAFFSQLRNFYISQTNKGEERDIQTIVKAYSLMYDLYQGELGHYFRTLYNIVKFVHTSEVENKRFYTNLIRAQLSNQELLIIFYNGITPLGLEKFKPLIEEYGLLKAITSNLLLNRANDIELYKKSAFGL